MDRKPDRNLGLDIMRATEAAALAAARWVGRGDKIGADGAAVDAMRLVLNSIHFDGIVVIGEGEKDEAPMLFNGEQVGTGDTPQVDVAVDPIDGTRLLSRGEANAVSVIAISQRGTMFDPGPCVYMEKIATGPEAADAIDLEKPLSENIKAVARAKGIRPSDVTVTMLDRDRHEGFIQEVRDLGARLRLISDGDVAGAITAGRGILGVDMLYGIGGTPEGVVSACALTCLGGAIQGRLWPRNDDERQRAVDAGYDLSRVLTTKDLVSSEEIFFAASGITDGVLLEGVRYTKQGPISQSIVMRAKTGTIRTITSEHRWDKLADVSQIEYH